MSLGDSPGSFFCPEANRANSANQPRRGRELDESLDSFKCLRRVLAGQSDTICILLTLTPPGVVMAVANEFDPSKD